ncbi:MULTISPECIES: cysteine-rich CWC family protein [Alicyclobacillus]|uniref:cysteine-rich CWC family protein n=1 Tax=Alicyclobacillus TaxID=29330 RepID=UPI0009F91D45|nr:MULTISPECIES: cysteine-rich CWC family protein [Alicyclobacillus]
MSNANKCPICGGDNNCGNVAGKPHGTCWCDRESFPKKIFDKIPSKGSEKTCICQNCLEKLTGMHSS